ncbi:uncharacterized protein LOC111355195 [Spodoptera litura]|uniref:Uncharacterized protein LOC111355195 n=1 Tax=Spodoptera litura TaxID=69820 RepID=A0A9J7IVG1_SPOLT|nr:uncharacterized protein LOC111355195 [Spodoptera litura]
MFCKELLLTLAIASDLLIIPVSGKEMELSDGILHRSTRQVLLWPNSTLLQFNAGFGFPSAAKHINVNYAFQANFQLPWNRTQIPLDILEANSGYVGTARKKREVGIKYDSNGDYQDDAKLYHFYKHVEAVLDGFGHNGKSCVLQTLCQLGAEPLHSDDEEDLLHEMATFVLNPKNDGIHHLTENDDTYPYIKAYTDGENQEDCSKLYHGCALSFIDVFTKLHDQA